MPRTISCCALRILAIMAALCAGVSAETVPDRTQTNRDIHVEPGDKLTDVTCLNCSIYVRGQIAGDATAVNGNIVVEEGAQVAGDVTALHGDARLESASHVAGDVTTIGGTIRRAPQATVDGDVTSLGGGWVLLIFAVPLAILGGIIALIVWLVQRNRRAAPVPA